MNITSLFLASFFGILFPLTASAAFSDVSYEHPYSKAILTLQEEGILEGYTDGSFRPDQTISRAEFIKILVAFQFKSSGTQMPACSTINFSDVESTSWYASYVCAAHASSLVDGYPDGSFRPSATINFVEASKIISNFFNTLNAFCSGMEPIAGPEGCPVDAAHPWYEWYVRSLAEREAIPYSIESFEQSITRGEMAEIVDRVRTARSQPSRSYGEIQSMNTSVNSVQLSQYIKNIEDYLLSTSAFRNISAGDLRVRIEEISPPYVRGTFYEPWAKKTVPFLATNREESGRKEWRVLYEYQQVPIHCSLPIWDWGFPQSMASKVCGNPYAR